MDNSHMQKSVFPEFEEKTILTYKDNDTNGTLFNKE